MVRRCGAGCACVGAVVRCGGALRHACKVRRCGTVVRLRGAVARCGCGGAVRGTLARVARRCLAGYACGGAARGTLVWRGGTVRQPVRPAAACRYSLRGAWQLADWRYFSAHASIINSEESGTVPFVMLNTNFQENIFNVQENTTNFDEKTTHFEVHPGSLFGETFLEKTRHMSTNFQKSTTNPCDLNPRTRKHTTRITSPTSGKAPPIAPQKRRKTPQQQSTTNVQENTTNSELGWTVPFPREKNITTGKHHQFQRKSKCCGKRNRISKDNSTNV